MYDKWKAQQQKNKSSPSVPPASDTPARQSSAMSVTSTGRATSSRLRQQARQSYLDSSSLSDTASVAEKRGGSVIEDMMSDRTKLARSTSGGRRAGARRRTPTPVNLSEGALVVIDNQLVLRLPISDSEVYRGRMTVHRLNLQPNDKLVDDALHRLRGISYDPILADNASMGVVPLLRRYVADAAGWWMSSSTGGCDC